ncbi:MAG: hypothetical protein ACP5SD_03050 [Elusimicrobiales bacterium]
MKYWVFINDDIIGPLSIEEISSKNYLSKELLVCPSESSAVAPSNWYFAKELPEFEKYFNSKNVVVEDEFDLNEIISSVSYIPESENKKNFLENLDYEEILIEKNILNEKLNIKEKENLSYKNKVSSLELKIGEIQKKLDSTLEAIKNYENKLKEKDLIIEKLSKEVEEIKTQKQEYSIKSEVNESKSEKNTSEFKSLEEPKDLKLTEFLEVGKDDSNNVLENESFENFGKAFVEAEEKSENFVADKIDLESKEEFKNEESNIEKTIEKREDEILDFKSDFNEEIKEEIKKDFELKELKTFSADEAVKEGKIEKVEIKTNDDKEESFDPFSVETKSLTPTEIEQSLISEESDNQSKFDNLVEMKLSSAPLEKDSSIFQVADVKLELAKTNMDVLESKNIEPITSPQVPDIEDKNKFKFEDDNLKIETQNIVSEQKDKEIKNIEVNQIVKEPSTDYEIKDNKETEALKEPELKKEEIIIKPKFDEIKETADISSEFLDKKIDIASKVEERISQAKYSQRKKIKPVFKVIGILGFIVFFAFSIIYILKSDSSNSMESSKIASKPKFPKESVAEQSIEPSTQTRINTSPDLNVSKINENVRKSIDIVKNYDLGDGKGKMQSWFSNTFSASNQVKEEWNATFLSGNLFVVQYRVLRYKQEPIVYLFEVDVEKNNIVRGINNNAIDLLSGKGLIKKTVAKSKVNVKKINENIEKDEDMF